MNVSYEISNMGLISDIFYGKLREEGVLMIDEEKLIVWDDIYVVRSHIKG